MNSRDDKLELMSKSPKSPPSVYSLISRNRTPRLNPGGAIEIEIYLSGYGVPDKNKLVVQLSSPYIIDEDSPGKATLYKRHSTKRPIGNNIPLETLEFNISNIGVTMRLDTIYFAEVAQTVPECGLKNVYGEGVWGSERKPPIYLQINTSKKARPGNYEIALVFTYKTGTDSRQDCKAVPVHITSWIERYQWLIYLGVGVAFASLVINAIGAFLNGNGT